MQFRYGSRRQWLENETRAGGLLGGGTVDDRGFGMMKGFQDADSIKRCPSFTSPFDPASAEPQTLPVPPTLLPFPPLHALHLSSLSNLDLDLSDYDSK
jgi:hypothetical protein